MSTLQTNRVQYFDTFRGIGILLMVMGHIGFGMSFSQYIHTFHMPMFFFVSGYFYKSGKYKFWKYLGHESRTLLIPYTVFVILCQILHYLYTHEWSCSYFVKSLLSSNHNRVDVEGALWFLLCLFSAKIIFFFIQELVKNEYLRAFIAISATILGQCIPGVKLPLCIDSALSCIGIMYIGYLLKKHETDSLSKKLISLPIFVLVVIQIIQVAATYFNKPVNIRTNYYFVLPLYWISSMCAIIFYVNLSKLLDKTTSFPFIWINSGLKYLGRNSLVYLCLNEIVIFVSLGVVNKILTPGGPIWLDAIRLAIVLLLTMGILAVANELFLRTKLRVLLGKF